MISPAATAPDPACCLYSTVQTNRWSIRFAFVFGPAPTPVAVGAVTMTKDANPKRLAQAIAGGSTEVRFPIDLRLLGTQERP